MPFKFVLQTIQFINATAFYFFRNQLNELIREAKFIKTRARYQALSP